MITQPRRIFSAWPIQDGLQLQCQICQIPTICHGRRSKLIQFTDVNSQAQPLLMYGMTAHAESANARTVFSTFYSKSNAVLLLARRDKTDASCLEHQRQCREKTVQSAVHKSFPDAYGCQESFVQCNQCYPLHINARHSQRYYQLNSSIGIFGSLPNSKKPFARARASGQVEHVMHGIAAWSLVLRGFEGWLAAAVLPWEFPIQG